MLKSETILSRLKTTTANLSVSIPNVTVRASKPTPNRHWLRDSVLYTMSLTMRSVPGGADQTSAGSEQSTVSHMNYSLK